MDKKETLMERLRRLDESATKGATVVSLIVGIISALFLGAGICCICRMIGKNSVVGDCICVVESRGYF